MNSPSNIRLSSAVAISARFPWITPAATVPISDIAPSKFQKMRLVDGGYLDNSGVDTALDLVESLRKGAESTPDKPNPGLSGTANTPFGAVRFNLIVLSGGDYPVRSSFALGESLEPIRTFLSTRESRAYVAIEHANRTFPPRLLRGTQLGEAAVAVTAAAVRRTKLINRFYDLPLGWALADRTRDIISRQSGRYWDCDPDERFEPTLNGFPSADCIQLLVHYELSNSLGQASEDLALSSYARHLFETNAPPRIPHQPLISCYRDKVLSNMTLTQSRDLDALLKVWDNNPQWDQDFYLAYILGTVAHESGNFSYQSEVITEEAANQRYGRTRGVALGNTQPEDPWRYRGRGMIQLTGRANYRSSGNRIGVDLERWPDLLFVPEVGARVATVGFFFTPSNLERLKRQISGPSPNWAALRRIVNGGLTGTDDVRNKTNVFAGCIAQAKAEHSLSRIN